MTEGRRGHVTMSGMRAPLLLAKQAQVEQPGQGQDQQGKGNGWVPRPNQRRFQVKTRHPAWAGQWAVDLNLGKAEARKPAPKSPH